MYNPIISNTYYVNFIDNTIYSNLQSYTLNLLLAYSNKYPTQIKSILLFLRSEAKFRTYKWHKLTAYLFCLSKAKIDLTQT